MQRTLVLTPKKGAENILLQTIFARINATFAPRSPLQPYSTSPSPRLSLALFLLLLHQAIHTKIQSYKDCIETAPFWAEAKFASLFFENCAGNSANWSENLRRNWSIKEFCADGKRARNFCAGNAFPVQTKLYSLGRFGFSLVQLITKYVYTCATRCNLNWKTIFPMWQGSRKSGAYFQPIFACFLLGLLW